MKERWVIGTGFAVALTAVLVTLVLVPADGAKSPAALAIGLVLAVVQGASTRGAHFGPL